MRRQRRLEHVPPAWKNRGSNVYTEFASDCNHEPEGAGGRRRGDAVPVDMTPPGRRCGRNQLCPCGSGKKFKKCCGDHSC